MSARHIKLGNLIPANSPAFHITQFDPLQAVFHVPEREIHKLAKGQEAVLSFDAWPERRFDGQVLRVSPVVDPGTGTVKVTVQMAPDKALQPGMFGRVRILYDRRDNATLVPADAIMTEDARDSLFLVLDGVQDPHNLGACLRTAEAAGVSAVIVPRDRAASLTAVARKAAAGSAERVPVVAVTNLSRTLGRLKASGYWLTGLDGSGQATIYDVDLRGPAVLVLGAEGEGMRRLTREHCDRVVRIPMLGKVESLNVSAAAAVCLFEALRQRRGTAG